MYQKSGPLFYVFSRQGITLVDGNNFRPVYRIRRTSPGEYVAYLPEEHEIEMASAQGSFSSLNLYDTKVSDKFSLKNAVGGIAAGPKGILLATLRSENLIYSLSSATGTPLTATPLPRSPGDVVYNPAKQEAYIAADDVPSITVIEIPKYVVKQMIALDSPPDHLALSRDGSLLFISYKKLSEIDALDTEQKVIVKRLFPESAPPYNLETSSYGLLVTEPAGNQIDLYDSLFRKQAIPVNRPVLALMDSTGNRLYVCDNQGYFLVLQIPTGKIEHLSRIGNAPYSLIYVP